MILQERISGPPALLILLLPDLSVRLHRQEPSRSSVLLTGMPDRRSLSPPVLPRWNAHIPVRPVLPLLSPADLTDGMPLWRSPLHPSGSPHGSPSVSHRYFHAHPSHKPRCCSHDFRKKSRSAFHPVPSVSFVLSDSFLDSLSMDSIWDSS